MKKIDHIIYGKLFEISFLIAFVILSYPIWLSLDINKQLANASVYQEAQYSYLDIEHNHNGPMFPMKNEEAMDKLSKTKINVTNETKTMENYSLILKIDKTSTLDYQFLNIFLDGKIQALKIFPMTEDYDYFYFVLDSNSIVGGKKTYNFLMWMDYETGNEMQGKSLNYSFELLNGINL